MCNSIKSHGTIYTKIIFGYFGEIEKEEFKLMSPTFSGIFVLFMTQQKTLLLYVHTLKFPALFLKLLRNDIEIKKIC